VLTDPALLRQSFLMSATLSSELDELKRLVLHSPAVLRLEGDDASGQLTQFFVNVPSEDRYLVLYALLRLELISGKALFFVNDVDACYRLKLFLEQFSIGAAVLNAELPANSRQHILQQFNKVGLAFCGLYAPFPSLTRTPLGRACLIT